MKLFLALSCLQGRSMKDAASTLLSLSNDITGLQLTPGCTPPFPELECQTRTHHGFTKTAYKHPVWKQGRLMGRWDSVHPPLSKHVIDARAHCAYMQDVEENDVVLETMYLGYADMCGDMLRAAMRRRRKIAVDIAHVDIQRRQNVLQSSVFSSLQDYDNIAEIHVSASHGCRDVHGPIDPNSWGVKWAKERAQDGTPVILECYMHRLSDDERRRQVEILLQ